MWSAHSCIIAPNIWSGIGSEEIMLAAFNYYDPEEENRIRNEIKNSQLFDKEIEMARKFAELHNPSIDSKSTMIGDEKVCCPICKSKHVNLFYEKWNVKYLRCDSCYSIFADVDENTEQEYRQLHDMIELRISKEYQEKAAISRKQMWNELLDWLKFRTYRYLGENTNLTIVDYGTRYYGLIDLLKKSDMCGKYELRDSILKFAECDSYNNQLYGEKQADVVLCLDYIQHENDPIQLLRRIKLDLKQEGILFLSTRAGSGFDILALRENNRNVFPYEHIMMPSKEGLKILLEKAGYEMLEITTPGTFDWNYVKSNRNKISGKEYFLKYLVETLSPNMEAEFQRFLQQSGMSSYAQVVARPICK